MGVEVVDAVRVLVVVPGPEGGNEVGDDDRQEGQLPQEQIELEPLDLVVKSVHAADHLLQELEDGRPGLFDGDRSGEAGFGGGWSHLEKLDELKDVLFDGKMQNFDDL